jgi:site-specific DNA-methyltransferase (cytosine-N4-specific)
MTPVTKTASSFQEVLFDRQDDWTFNGHSTRELTHCFHDYPARMIPQIASKLLNNFGKKSTLLFDPYCGTGTSLVEALLHGINAVGTDLNPLARLIAQAKTSILDIDRLDDELKRFYRILTKPLPKNHISISEIKGINRLEFWFKPIVIDKLSYLKKVINDIEDENIKNFFKVAFSETVRDSSNTRSEEFKLYRYDEEKLKYFNPNVFVLISQKLRRNRIGLEVFFREMRQLNNSPVAHIYDFNSVERIPIESIKPSSVDIVITSPPYGDSHTTVAYGQYSRLSAAWLDLSEPSKIDNKLMGGKIYKGIPNFPCDKLNNALLQIQGQDIKRACEVASFYTDLQKSIHNVSGIVRRGGYVCYVVGNRKVKGIKLPTDDAVKSFFEYYKYKYINTYMRSIPNKRMPLRNSPSNIIGALDSTMVNEYIVIMQQI